MSISRIPFNEDEVKKIILGKLEAFNSSLAEGEWKGAPDKERIMRIIRAIHGGALADHLAKTIVRINTVSFAAGAEYGFAMKHGGLKLRTAKHDANGRITGMIERQVPWEESIIEMLK